VPPPVVPPPVVPPPVVPPAGPPAVLPAVPFQSLKGKSVICGRGGEALQHGNGIFLVVDANRLAWYPSPAIATSWDIDWQKPTSVDCTNAMQVPDMPMKGQAVTCKRGGENLNHGDGVFRVVDVNTLAWYPSVPIAASWDPNWDQYIPIDCTGATQAADMELNRSVGHHRLRLPQPRPRFPQW
jgi:hypothetical protein